MTESPIYRLLAASGVAQLVRTPLHDPAVESVGTDGNRVWVVGAAEPDRINVMWRSLGEGGERG